MRAAALQVTPATSSEYELHDAKNFAPSGMGKVYVIDDEPAVSEMVAVLLHTLALEVDCFTSAEKFLAVYRPAPPECLVLDVRMPGMSGFELQAELERRQLPIPIVFLTGHGDIPMAIQAVKGGAVDLLTKPFDPEHLIESVRTALAQSELGSVAAAAGERMQEKMNSLTKRERQVLELALSGLHNKIIARELGISPRTVEIHRAHILRKTGAGSLLELLHLARNPSE